MRLLKWAAAKFADFDSKHLVSHFLNIEKNTKHLQRNPGEILKFYPFGYIKILHILKNRSSY